MRTNDHSASGKTVTASAKLVKGMGGKSGHSQRMKRLRMHSPQDSNVIALEPCKSLKT